MLAEAIARYCSCKAPSHSLIYTIPGRAPRLANAQQKGENFLKLFEESSKWKHIGWHQVDKTVNEGGQNKILQWLVCARAPNG